MGLHVYQSLFFFSFCKSMPLMHCDCIFICCIVSSIWSGWPDRMTTTGTYLPLLNSQESQNLGSKPLHKGSVYCHSCRVGKRNVNKTFSLYYLPRRDGIRSHLEGGGCLETKLTTNIFPLKLFFQHKKENIFGPLYCLLIKPLSLKYWIVVVFPAVAFLSPIHFF